MEADNLFDILGLNMLNDTDGEFKFTEEDMQYSSKRENDMNCSTNSYIMDGQIFSDEVSVVNSDNNADYLGYHDLVYNQKYFSEKETKSHLNQTLSTLEPVSVSRENHDIGNSLVSSNNSETTKNTHMQIPDGIGAPIPSIKIQLECETQNNNVDNEDSLLNASDLSDGRSKSPYCSIELGTSPIDTNALSVGSVGTQIVDAISFCSDPPIGKSTFTSLSSACSSSYTESYLPESIADMPSTSQEATTGRKRHSDRPKSSRRSSSKAKNERPKMYEITTPFKDPQLETQRKNAIKARNNRQKHTIKMKLLIEEKDKLEQEAKQFKQTFAEMKKQLEIKDNIISNLRLKYKNEKLHRMARLEEELRNLKSEHEDQEFQFTNI